MLIWVLKFNSADIKWKSSQKEMKTINTLQKKPLLN